MSSDGPLPDFGGWTVLSRARNPWGQVAVTVGGKSLHGRSREYMDRLLAQQKAQDPPNRRHHYVPRSYLREWSFDGKRIWALNTSTGEVKPLGLTSVCVQEDFYRVVGSDGGAHNRVELMFGVIDTELRRLQRLFNELEDPEELEFDDAIALGVTVAVQRMRTLQQRRLLQQRNAWTVAQNPNQYVALDDRRNPHMTAGLHTQLLFEQMWEASDVMTLRQIEVWDDPLGRFMTCDTPVLVPFKNRVRPSLVAAPYVIWPISPRRAVVLSNDAAGEKAVLKQATGRMAGMTRDAIEHGRELMIFASEDQRDRLPRTKKFLRRAQTRMRCSQHSPTGEYIPPPGCCIEVFETLASGPDVSLCSHGLHRHAPEMQAYV